MDEYKLDTILYFIDKENKPINNKILNINNIDVFSGEDELEEYLRKIENDGYIKELVPISGGRFLVSLTPKGIDFMKKGCYKQQKKIFEIEQIKDKELRIIASNVNESILETNQNTRETNRSLVKILKTQIIISILMFAVAICVGIISVLNHGIEKKRLNLEYQQLPSSKQRLKIKKQKDSTIYQSNLVDSLNIEMVK